MAISMKLISGVVFIAAFSCFLLASTAYAAVTKDVNVVNTPDVNIANIPDVNVTGSHDVNVANVPDVNVTNDETSPIPVTIQNGGQTVVEWRYVGLTTHEDDGRYQFSGLSGIAAMNAACSSDFGTGARASTIGEAYFRTATPDTRSGWLVPGAGPMTVVPVVVATLTNFQALDAATGRAVGNPPEVTEKAALRFAYCTGFNSALMGFQSAPATQGEGIVITKNCLSPLPAACSAPVAIPIIP